MRKRKRTATIMDTWNEIFPTPASASAIAEKDDPIGEYGPRPNPSAKCGRPSGQPDKEDISNGICKAQEVNVKPSASNSGEAVTRTGNSLPPEIWKLIGKEVK
jgi:hypothetical protein